MRIFMTGATGYIGSAVLDVLVRSGHQVTALVRDNEKSARVAAKGGRPQAALQRVSASRQYEVQALQGFRLVGHISHDSMPSKTFDS